MVHERLSISEFSTAIKHGHGRAFLYVQQYGLNSVADIVLESRIFANE
jgi:hypothetical protein